MYATYDVTAMIQSGANVVAAVIGSGWPGHVPDGGKVQDYSGHTPTFKMLLKIEPEVAGAAQYITSAAGPGGNWTGTFDGPILLDDIYGGETYDATKEMPGWDSAGFDVDGAAATWVPAMERKDPSIAHAALSSQLMPPIRARELLPGKVLATPLPGGLKVVDYGQNIAGWGKLSISGCPRGTTIKMSFSEVLHVTDHAPEKCGCPPGTDASSAAAETCASSLLDPLHNCTWVKGMVNMQYLMCTLHHGSKTGDRCAFDLYTCKGASAPEVYEPRFTYHGFRFAQLENLPQGPGVSWSLEARVVHSDVEGDPTTPSSLSFGGSASSSLARLQSNIRWTQLDNLHSIPTDCDQRTERQGWMADASVSAEQAFLNFRMAPLYRNWMQDMVDVQQDFPALDPNDKRACGASRAGAIGALAKTCHGAMTDTVPHPVRQLLLLLLLLLLCFCSRSCSC